MKNILKKKLIYEEETINNTYFLQILFNVIKIKSLIVIKLLFFRQFKWNVNLSKIY